MIDSLMTIFNTNSSKVVSMAVLKDDDVWYSIKRYVMLHNTKCPLDENGKIRSKDFDRSTNFDFKVKKAQKDLCFYQLKYETLFMQSWFETLLWIINRIGF